MTGKIKITDVSGTNIEGTAEELTKFFQDNNCNLGDYLTPQRGNTNEKGKLWPIIMFGILFIAASILMKLLPKNQTWFIILSILLFGLYGALLLCTYLRWKWPATIIVAFIGVFLLLIAFGVMTPEDAAKDIKKQIDKSGKSIAD